MIKLSWLWHEIRLQMKNGLYAIYVLVNLIYLFLLGYVPENFRPLAVSLIIFSDPTALGMIFIGAFMLLEKISGVTGGIAVSPLGAKNYIKGKVFSMLIISLVTSMVLAMGVKGVDFNLLGLAVVVALSSILFTMLGILTAVYTKTINQYLMVIIAVGLVISVPLITYFDFVHIAAAKLIPTYWIFALTEKAIRGDSILGLPLLILMGWLAAAYFVTIHCVNQKLFRG